MSSTPSTSPWRQRAIPLVVAALALVAGCNRDAERAPAGFESPRYGGTLRLSSNDDFRTLDPAIGYDETTHFGIHLMFNSLVDYSYDLKLEPELATHWELSEDGLTYTFHMRHGVMFHNGREATAEDVAYALHRALDPKVSCPAAVYYRGIEGADAFTSGETDDLVGVRALDRYTLQIKLIDVDMAFLHAMAMPFAAPVPREEVDKWGDQFGRHPVGTGPFQLVEWRPGEQVVFERNPHYWEDGLPYLDKLVYLPGYSREVAFMKFERGEVDQLDRLTSPDYLWVMANPELKAQLVENAAIDFYGESMNCEMPPFDNKLFRKALNHAVNRQTQLKLRNNRNVLADGPLPAMLRGKGVKVQAYEYDPDKARALLAEAGYPNGYPEVLPYWTLQAEASVQLAQALQQDLKAVGVNIDIKLVDFPTYLTATGRRGEVAFAYGSWLMDFPDPSNFLVPLFHSASRADENSSNSVFYSNPEVDRLLDAAQVETDSEQRQQLFLEAERLIIDDAPYIFEYSQKNTEMVQPWLKGYRIHPVWPRNMREVWLDLEDTRATREAP